MQLPHKLGEAMRAIFISYRREDSEGHAGRLFESLSDHFGKDAVFMDVTAIEPGRDFRRAIDEQIASCGVLLAVVGKDWLAARSEAGARRLDDPTDFVRLEVASALKRDIPVVPVLVHGAVMPHAEELPADLTELAYRNAVELTHARWESDVQILITALRPYVDRVQTGGAKAVAPQSAVSPAPTISAPAPAQAPVPAARPARRRWAVLSAGVFVLVAATGGAAFYLHEEEPAPPDAWTDWMAMQDLNALRSTLPKGERFPLALEGRISAEGRLETRARFGAPPPGRTGFYWNAGATPEQYKKRADELTADGFVEYSRQVAVGPAGGRATQYIWVK
ncbi:MAG TPA: toll/interleukin-1 receptor domain-containing protein [Burkholderiaceae bacterium]|nr:toll/interleukin-1 receptor domain-containing protein [Burkholderiaceae bacterium]